MNPVIEKLVIQILTKKPKDIVRLIRLASLYPTCSNYRGNNYMQNNKKK